MKHSKLTAERLREALDYNPGTGQFVWKIKPTRKVAVGAVAGHLTNGYRYISVDKESYTASRLAWLYVYGSWPSPRMGFHNGNALDCSIKNLFEKPTVTAASRSTYGREHRAANPMHHRSKDLKKQFGITLDDYQAMFVKQGGVCAICEKPEIATRGGKDLWLSVDHCHSTGAIRGLLCSNCNRGLGCFMDNPEAMDKAASYLRHHSEAQPSHIIPFKRGVSA